MFYTVRFCPHSFCYLKSPFIEFPSILLFYCLFVCPDNSFFILCSLLLTPKDLSLLLGECVPTSPSPPPLSLSLSLSPTYPSLSDCISGSPTLSLSVSLPLHPTPPPPHPFPTSPLVSLPPPNPLLYSPIDFSECRVLSVRRSCLFMMSLVKRVGSSLWLALVMFWSASLSLDWIRSTCSTFLRPGRSKEVKVRVLS